MATGAFRSDLLSLINSPHMALVPQELKTLVEQVTSDASKTGWEFGSFNLQESPDNINEQANPLFNANPITQLIMDNFKASGFGKNLLRQFGLSEEYVMDNLEKIMPQVCQMIGMNHKDLKDFARITLAMNDDDIERVCSFLDTGLDPNIKVRKDKFLVHFCKSEKMLDILVERGLDLNKNNPLYNVPMNVFKRMINTYKVCPYDDYHGFEQKNKILYINRMLREDRATMIAKFKQTVLLPGLCLLIINMIYPLPRNPTMN